MSISRAGPPENLYHANIAEDETRSSCSLNRCNLSPWIIGSEEFQAHPLPVDTDSNGPAGATLKARVESRFGILATFHQGRLAADAAAREAFLLDRTRGNARSIGVLMQLDLLYTFCQDELRRRFPGEPWRTLYRGTHDSDEYTVREESGRAAKPFSRELLVQLNNLSSFSSDPEVAREFGSSAWEVKVPFPKIVFFSGLLPKSVLAGESEHLVLAGYYHVRTRMF